MILRRLAGSAAVLTLGGSVGVAFALTPVRIVSPAPDSVVRERINITVPTSAVPDTTPPGYVMVNIDGRFEAAVARPRKGALVTYVWDTKAKTPTGQLGIKDGKHEIRVNVVDSNQRQIGNADRVEVFIQNEVRSAPSQVLLRYRFTPGVQHTYVEKINVRQSDQEIYKARVVLRRTVDDMLPGSVAMIRERIDRDSAQSDQGQPVPLPTAGQSITFNVLPQGTMIPGRKMQRLGQKAVLDLPLFPSTPVRVGQSWNAPVKLAPMYQGMDAITVRADNAKSTLDSFEWESGMPTAKIVTQLAGTATAVVQGVPTGYKVNGRRVTYFDWRRGRIMKIVDDYTLNTTDALGTVTVSSGMGGTPTGPAPGYNPYRGYGGPGGGSAMADLGSPMKVLSTTQLTG